MSSPVFDPRQVIHLGSVGVRHLKDSPRVILVVGDAPNTIPTLDHARIEAVVLFGLLREFSDGGRSSVFFLDSLSPFVP